MIREIVVALSVCNGTFCQTSWSELNPQDLHGGRREPFPASCPLNSKHIQTHIKINATVTILKHLFIFILCVQVFWLYVCMFTTCIPGTCKGQRTLLVTLALELQMIARMETEARFCASAVHTLELWAISPASVIKEHYDLKGLEGADDC